MHTFIIFPVNKNYFRKYNEQLKKTRLLSRPTNAQHTHTHTHTHIYIYIYHVSSNNNYFRKYKEQLKKLDYCPDQQMHNTHTYIHIYIYIYVIYRK